MLMKCPNDNSDLQMSERQGVEIDYCPECRGVWLDRGELDKIIERLESDTAANFQDNQSQFSRHQPQNDGYRNDYNYKKSKKSSWLGEIFD